MAQQLKITKPIDTTQNNTVCPKLFGPQKMYQNGPQMSNYCAQMPPHTRLYIHGGPQIQKSPYGYTQGPKFIVFQNARIQTIFEDVKKAYFKFNHITMRPAYNGEELFFEQNKSFLKNLLFLRQKIVINISKN